MCTLSTQHAANTTHTHYKIVNKIDLFGKRIEFNMDKNGNYHKTLVGAVFSIFVYLCYFYYL